MTSIAENKGKMLEEIIAARRSVRRFTPQVPSRDLVERIVKAGLLAPYSGLGITREDFRRIIVIPRESPVMQQVSAILTRNVQETKKQLEEEMAHDKQVQTRGQAYLQVLKRIDAAGVAPLVAKAPYYLVVAEEKTIPHIEHCSLAHCMQNMWLEATALGLGFQLVTATQRVSDDQEFAKLLGLPTGIYVLDGCLLGYSAETPPPVPRPDPKKVVTWL